MNTKLIDGALMFNVDYLQNINYPVRSPAIYRKYNRIEKS